MGGLLSATELASIRADASAAVCDTSCTIQRKVKTPDGYGGSTETYNTIATVLCGMAQPSAPQLAAYASEIGALAIWKVFFPSGTDVQEQDHLVIGSDTFEVHVRLTPQSYSALESIIAAEVR